MPNNQPTMPDGGLIPRGMGNISLIPLNVRIAPDGYQQVQVRVVNESSIVEHYLVLVEGLPADWIKIPQSTVQLMPDQETTFHFTIGPLPPFTPADTFPYRLVLRSTSNPQLEGSAYGMLHILPGADFTVEVSQTPIRNHGLAQVRLANTGNTRQRLAVSGNDPEGRLIVGSTDHPVDLDAGEQTHVDLRVDSMTRPLTGKAATIPFTIDARSDFGTHRSAAGRLEVTPLIPRWLLSALILFLATTVGIGACTITRLKRTVAAEVAAIATATQVSSDTYDVAATAYYENWDYDIDGLTYQEELQYGTDPFDDDKDGDGLNDGDEIRYGTNPLTVDFDGDGLSDGEEVNCNPNADGAARGQCTNPRDIDSDKDGLPDYSDPDSSKYNPPVLDPNQLLEDPSFEQTTLCWVNAVTGVQKCELQVPVGWKLMVLDNVPAPESPDGSPYAFPEMGSISKNQMGECIDGGTDPICQIFVDDKALKVFKGGRPMRFALYRDIVLQPGAYKFGVHYFADAVESRGEGGSKIWAQPGAAQLQLCIKSAEYDHKNWQLVEIGKAGSDEVDFVVPTARTVTLYVNVKNPLALANNGWFFDDWSLQKIHEYNDTLAGLEPEHGCEVDMGAKLSN